jgi:hypothetical protein
MNKLKIIFLIESILICTFCGVLLNPASAKQANPFENYRFNPFQYPYPEYQYTAEQIPVDQLSSPEVSTKTINCFGVSISFPEYIAEQVIEKSKSLILIKSKNNKGLIVNFEKEKLMGCSDEAERIKNRDFCSAFSSTGDFYNKLFSLTPADLSKEKYSSTGYKWIVHRKGHMFNNVSKIAVYKGINYKVYRTDIKDKTMSLKTELVIFTESIKPDYLILSMNFTDDMVINTIVKSLK